MLDLAEFYNSTVFEQKIEIPTDSVYTEIRGDRHGLQFKKVYNVEPVLVHVSELRKQNDENRGFSTLRHFRALGSIPTHVWLRFQHIAVGDEVEIRRLEKKWLRANPEFCAVNHRSF